MRVGAHRGWTRHGPENTVPALLGARGAADFVELDVRRSVDGLAVLSHDPVVGGLEVAKATAAELAALDLGDGVGVPTLAGLLAQDPLPLDIEVKPEVVEPDILDQVVALLRPEDMVSSFNWSIAARMRELAPGTPTGLLFETGIEFTEAIRAAVTGGHEWVLAEDVLVTGESVRMALGEGLAVGVWTVNTAKRAAELADYGVGAVISDHPDRIRTEVQP